jgi:hypothetical protein
MRPKPKPTMSAIGIRVDDEIRRATEAAAAADSRSVASLVKKVLVEHLRAKGFLPPASAGVIAAGDLNASNDD